ITSPSGWKPAWRTSRNSLTDRSLVNRPERFCCRRAVPASGTPSVLLGSYATVSFLPRLQGRQARSAQREDLEGRGLGGLGGDRRVIADDGADHVKGDLEVPALGQAALDRVCTAVLSHLHPDDPVATELAHLRGDRSDRLLPRFIDALAEVHELLVDPGGPERALRHLGLLRGGDVVHAGVGGDAHGPQAGLAELRERSEEHTSELQSLRHIVCRLLLEKKK